MRDTRGPQARMQPMPPDALKRLRKAWEEGVPLSVLSERYRMRPEKVKKLCADIPRGDWQNARWMTD